MLRTRARLLTALIACGAAALLAAGYLLGCHDRRTAASGRVTLFVTGDSRGYLEPCGCRRDQAGGLAGRATLIGAHTPAERMVVDVGNMTPGGRPYEILKLDYLLEGMSTIGYDAVNLGKTEAELDLPALRRLASANLPFVSANVLPRQAGPPIASSYRVLSKGGLRIGVTGVAWAAPRDVGPGVLVKPPLEALAQVIPDLRRQCDYLVVLAFTDSDTIHKIAEQFPEIDCILGGDVPQSSNFVQQLNRAINFNVMDRGKVVGQIDLVRSGSAFRSENGHGVKVIGEHLAPDPAMQRLIARYKTALRDKRYELASVEGMERIPGQESTADEYVGEDKCATCHAAAHAVAQSTAHTHAYQTLVRKGSEYDPECLRCHSVGYALYSGFVDAVKTPQLENVQCESCHGRGKAHTEAMLARSRAPGTRTPTGALRAVTPASCVRCHDEENSENFRYATFWPKIAHGR